MNWNDGPNDMLDRVGLTSSIVATSASFVLGDNLDTGACIVDCASSGSGTERTNRGGWWSGGDCFSKRAVDGSPS
ncbi:hypothetical protein [Micromonospora globispora]|uniref:hypothetical protein n=1 Tax=Micromonospora globispora TaxID=1450148 RepID=UPI001639943A|nr:hypothetical protein [Micromonospora globispora]